MAEVPKMTISKLIISDQEKLQILAQKLQHTQYETLEWMAQMIVQWFGFLPCEWQAENSLHLYHNKDIFLTSKTGHSWMTKWVHEVYSIHSKVTPVHD